MIQLSLPDCIRTFTGKDVNVFNPKPEMFCIEDVAYSLAKQPRFSGHLNDEIYYDDDRQYSTLQHQIHCCELASQPVKFQVLNHDNTETYIVDLAKPIKQKVEQYNLIEHDIASVLAPALGFKYPFDNEVHEVDYKMLIFEWHAFMINKTPPPETIPASQKEYFYYHGHYYIMTKKQARTKFMELFNNLKP